MKKIIEEMFEEYLLTPEFTEDSEAYEATHEQYVKATELAFDTFVREALAECFKVGSKNEDILIASNIEYEKKGFVQGFKLAMRIREECLSL